MKTPKNLTSRRKFMRTTAYAATATALGGSSLFGAPAILRPYRHLDATLQGVTLGVITYSYRSMPDQSAEAMLQYIKDSGVHAIELMGDVAENYAGKPQNKIDRRAYFSLMRSQRNGEELSMDQQKEWTEMQVQMQAYNEEVARWRATVSMEKFAALRKMYNEAGVRIYAFKPRAFEKDNSNEEIDWGLRVAKILGANHVTLEHPGDDLHTKKLGDMAKKHAIKIGYHGHEQQSPTLWDTALEQSKYNGLNLDLGHYVAAGNSQPLEIIDKMQHRIWSMHLKDRQLPAHGKGNVPWGSGDTPITQALRFMKEKQCKFPATIELEYDIPEGSNAVKEVQKCLEYCKKALS